MEQNNRFSQRESLPFLVILSFFLFLCLACKYDPVRESVNGLLEGDTLNVSIDTLPVELYTREGYIVSASSIGTSPLGYVKDPLFGSLSADFVTNIMWYQDNITFRDSVNNVRVLDLELKLNYDTVTYGDKSDINFEVYEVISDIPDSTKSDFKVPSDMINNSPINIETPAKLKDTAVYSVKLSTEYANKFIDQALIDDSSYYYYDTFRVHLKGLYIKVKERNSVGGGLIKVSHSTSTLTLRTIETNTQGVDDTVSTVYHLGDLALKKAKHINMYTTLLSPAVTTALTYPESMRIRPMAFIEALAGPRILIRFPTLPDLKNELGGKIIVNKAELVLPVNKEKLDTTYGFSVPPYISVYDSLKNSVISDDGILNGYMGGGYNTTSYEYRINIGNHLNDFFQDISGTELSDKLYLFAADFIYLTSTSSSPISIYSVKTPGRIVLNNRYTTNQPYLKIIYTKIPN
jgi:hypothetical protein